MVCKRCGGPCPEREEGLCFHCLVGLSTGLIDTKTNQPIEGVDEGFSERVKPTKKELRKQARL